MYELLLICPDLALFDRIVRSSDLDLIRAIGVRHVREWETTVYVVKIVIARGTEVVETLLVQEP